MSERLNWLIQTGRMEAPNFVFTPDAKGGWRCTVNEITACAPQKKQAKRLVVEKLVMAEHPIASQVHVPTQIVCGDDLCSEDYLGIAKRMKTNLVFVDVDRFARSFAALANEMSPHVTLLGFTNGIATIPPYAPSEHVYLFRPRHLFNDAADHLITWFVARLLQCCPEGKKCIVYVLSKDCALQNVVSFVRGALVHEAVFCVDEVMSLEQLLDL